MTGKEALTSLGREGKWANLSQNAFKSISLFVVFFGLSYSVYSSYLNNPFAEDDVRFILNAQGLGNSDQLTDVFGSLIANRIRPVSDFVLYLIFQVAGESSELWFVFRAAFLAITALLVYYAVRNSFKISLISFLAACLYLTSRFLQYHVTQVLGIMESINIILLLLIYISLNKHSETMKSKYLGFALLFFLTLFFSHERFQVIVLALVVYVLVIFRDRIAKLKWSVFFALPVVFGFLLKQVLEIPQLVGTGSASSLGFTFSSALTHSIQGLVQILGVNLGPPYLVGVPFESSPEWFQATALAVLLAGLTLLGALIVSIDRTRSEAHKYAFALFQLVLFACVFVAGMVTIRLEQRWLAAPFVVLMICAAKRITRKVDIGSTSAALFILGNLLLSSYYLPNSNQLFFNGWQAGAAATISQVGSAWEYSSEANKPLIIVDATNFEGLMGYVDSLMTANTPIDADVVGVPTIEDAKAIPGFEESVVLQIEEGTGKFLIVSSPTGFSG